MRELALAGALAVLFGVGSYYATGHFGMFTGANLAAGGAALLVAALLAAVRARRAGGPHARRAIARGLLLILAALALGVGAERAAHRSGLRADWTFERRYELSPPLAELLKQSPGLRVHYFYDPEDPRTRRTRLLVQELARASGGSALEHDIHEDPDSADEFGISAANSIVLEFGGDFEVVSRPVEGALYESLYRLHSVRGGVIGILRGEGEGDPERENELGFGGLAAALATEGYDLRSLVTLSLREVPKEIDAVLAIAPQRQIGARAQEALRRFLARGGALVALLEPGSDSGIEQLLSEWGLRSPDLVVIDPASGEGFGHEPEGLCPLVSNYETHPITRGLDSNRMTFFCGVRPSTCASRRSRTSSRRWPSAARGPGAPRSPRCASRRHGSSPRTARAATRRWRSRAATCAATSRPASSRSATATSPRTATCARSTTSTSP